MKIILIFLYFYRIFSIVKSTSETCNPNNADDCRLFTWRAWESCLGKCGNQSQTRQRVFCCNSKVLPHTVENCLLHCNLSRDFPVKQNQSCRVCQNNGTLVSVSAACVCTPRYKGGCCQGKHLVSVCSRPSLSEYSNFS